jgi:hypothetical protein
MLRWIERQYSIAGEAEDREANLPRLFTLDTCHTHRTIAVLQRLSSPDLNRTVALVPEGLTGHMQPLDTGELPITLSGLDTKWGISG